jgi:hypothetical protein
VKEEAMRHRTVLPVSLVVALFFALTATPLFAMQEQSPTPQAQECESSKTEGDQTFLSDCTSDFSEGLAVAAVGGPPEGVATFQVYDVAFTEQGAYIPERLNREEEVFVKVLAGYFAFRVQGNGVIVNPQGQPLERVLAVDPVTEMVTDASRIALGTDPDLVPEARERIFKVDAANPEYSCLLDTLCVLDPADFDEGEVFVRLDPGDTVYLPDLTTCFLCNSDPIDPTTGEIDPTAEIEANVLIWTPTTAFNGDLESAASHMARIQEGQLRAAPAWRLNPGSNCN